MRLFRLCSGFIHSQVLLACVRVGLFDRLREGPMSVDDVAGQIGIPPERAGHLLRAAAALELAERLPDGRFTLGVLGAAMVENESLLALVEHHALLYRDLADPVGLFSGSEGGTGLSQLWPYATADRPDALESGDVAAYSTLMAASQAMVAEQVLAAFSLKPFRTLMDIGGGAGAFLSAVAARWPHLDLTLADLPAVADIARTRLADAGLDGRVTVVGADVTRDALPGGFDVVSLVRILHDHDDDRALQMLTAARDAMHNDGVLLVAEPLADAPGAGPLIDAYFNVYLLAMGSGRPRSFMELSRLMALAGLGPVRRHRTRIPLITSVLTARRR